MSVGGMELAVVPWEPPSPSHCYAEEAMIFPFCKDPKTSCEMPNYDALPHPTMRRLAGTGPVCAGNSKFKFCAMRDLAHKIHTYEDLLDYSLHDRRETFLHWVAYDRILDETILRQERLRCPLLWCREPFADLGRLLKHVEVCDRLQDGDYWCPEHAAPEKFAFPDRTRSKSHLKLSNCFRHAVKVVRTLGPRRSKRTRWPKAAELGAGSEESTQTPPPPYARSVTRKKMEPRSAGMVPSTYWSGFKELSSVRSQCYELQGTEPVSNLEDFPGTANEYMDTDSTDDDDYSSVSSRSVSPIDDGYQMIDGELLSPVSPHYETASMRRILYYDNEALRSSMTCPITYPALLRENDLESSPVIISASHIQGALTMPHFDLPVDGTYITADQPKPQDFQSSNSSMHTSEKIVVERDPEAHKRSESSYLLQELALHPAPLFLTIGQDQHAMPRKERQMGTQLELVDSLRRVSNLLHERSLRNLRREPVTVDIHNFVQAMRSSDYIIEKGMNTLRMVFAGTLPTTLMDVYAMLHFAYVAAIVINQSEVVEVQSDLYADILNWSLAIGSTQERSFFVDIARRIWASPHIKANCPRLHDDVQGVLSQPCFMTVLPALAESSKSPTCRLGKRKASQSARDDHAKATTLLNTLTTGTAIYLCRQYLDVIEYTGLLSGPRSPFLRQMQGSPWREMSVEQWKITQQWEDKITKPLIEFMGLEGFRSIIINVQQLITNGAFQNVREIELKLIYDGQNCSRSASKYHSFLKQVRHLCKQVATFSQLPPFFHDQQYMKDIDVTSCFFHALTQRPDRSTKANPNPTTCTSNVGRMTIKDLPPLQTGPLIIPTSSLTSNLPSRSPTSSNSVPSAFSHKSFFSNNSTAPSSTSASLLNTPDSNKRSSGSFVVLSPNKRNNSSSMLFSPSDSTSPFTPSHTRRASQGSTTPSSPQVSYCPQCNEQFTGVFQKTNLARHVKSVHERKRIPCPLTTCTESFTRSDNLRTHQKKFGHWI